MHHPVKKKQNPFIKAIVLFVALIFGLFFYNKIATTNVMEGFFAAFEDSATEFNSQVEFTEAQRDSLIALASGFWEYQSDENAIMKHNDRIEITENGYIWQVEQIQLTLPHETKKNITHVFHGYFYPSSVSAFDTNYINCVIRHFPQLWIYEDDTCEIRKYFGTPKKDAIAKNAFSDLVMVNFIDDDMDVFIDGTTLQVRDRRYRPFPKENIQSFFPEGLIDKVYNMTMAVQIAEGKKYMVDKKKKEVVFGRHDKMEENIQIETHRECKDCLLLRDFIRKAIIEDRQKSVAEKREIETVTSVIQEYYMPLCLHDEIFSLLRSKKDEVPYITISFSLDWQGNVDNVSIRVSGDTYARKWRENEIKQEVERWKFQPLEKETTPFNVTVTDTLLS